MVLAVSTPSPFWFITRGTGAISLVLLTLTVALGIGNVRRTRIGGTPRFVLDSVHRSASLLAVSFVVVHVLTTLLDGFAPITLLDVVVPFGSAYRPLWLGLGAVAFDLLIAIVITSLLRRRLGYRAWRATHWLAYASWPVALVHGLGTGSDTRTHWMLVLSAGCVAVMLAAVLWRVSAGWPQHLGARLSAAGAAALVPLGLLAWLPSGPLAAGWAKQAGTPVSLLPNARSGSGSTRGVRANHVGEFGLAVIDAERESEIVQCLDGRPGQADPAPERADARRRRLDRAGTRAGQAGHPDRGSADRRRRACR